MLVARVSVVPFFFKFLLAIAISYLLGLGLGSFGRQSIPNSPLRPIAEARAEKEDPRALLNEICPKYGVPSVVALAVAERESGFNPDAVAYEPGAERFAVKVKRETGTKEPLSALVSSHGLMQVMGYNAVSYGVSISELYDVRQNLELGCAILGKHFAAVNRKLSAAHRWRGALTKYNGVSDAGRRYAAEVLAQVKEAAMVLALN